MKNLYKVTIERTTYQGHKSVETRELFAESPEKINTYRLGGFQQDSIKVLKARKIREQRPIEVDVDIDRNEIMFSISLDAHLDSTLEYNADLVKLWEESELEDESEFLESLGYVERSHDNSYNYCSDFDNDMNFKIFTKNPRSDYLYDDETIVLVREHTGLDARVGYRFKGFYGVGPYGGLSYFLDFHVRLTVLDSFGNDVDNYDGDYASGSMLEEYKIKSFDSKTQDLVITKDGQDFVVSWYHPAMGM